jgi:hypothetical protein
MKKLVVVLIVGAAAACGLFAPLGLDALADTRVNALCHMAYACCTPIERALFLNAPPFRDEGACRAELAEDRALAAVYLVDQQAKDAVARKTAEYDAEAAEECSRERLDAANNCDPKPFIGVDGRINFNALLLLVDPQDAECVALAQRAFTRGLQEDGDECFSDVDCADFGTCVKDPDDAEVITTRGECRTPHARGDDCSDGKGCQPGLACRPPEQGGGPPTCQRLVRKRNGESCALNGECDSAVCRNGTCAAAPDFDVEICDGQ